MKSVIFPVNLYLQTHVSEVEGDFQVVPEMICKLRIHVENLQNIFPKDFVEVTVGQRPHVSIRFT